MSRVTALSSIAPGEASDYSDMNTVLASLASVSAAVGYDNLADEGVDLRNISQRDLTDITVSTAYVERTTTVSAAPGADFNNEPTTPLSMGGNVELDWSGAPLTMDANTILIVYGELAVGAPSLAMGVPDSTNPVTVIGGANGGASACIMTTVNAGAYSLKTESRSSIGGRTLNNSGVFRERRTLTCLYVLEGGTDVVKKIALTFGSEGAANYRLYRAQLRAMIFKRTTTS